MSQSYALHIQGVNQIQWTASLFHKAPNLYAEIRLDGIVQRTRVIKRNLTPIWDETLTLLAANVSVILSIRVKHDTSKPIGKDPCIGRVDIAVDTLLRLCDNNQDVNLDLETESGKHQGTITLKLEPMDSSKTGLAAINNAADDIKLLGVEHPSTFTSSKFVDAVDTVGEAAQSTFVKSLSNIVSSLGLFVRIVDETAKVHPYANFAWQVVSSLYKAVKGQLERDARLIGLVKTMEDVYSFVEASDSFQNKVRLLEEAVSNILKQTVECAIFIREYTGHGFGGRLMRQTFGDDGQRIANFSQALMLLKQSLDSSNILQAVFVSTRTLEGVEQLVKMENLKLLNPTQMDASSRSECLPGTRQDILKFVTGWLTTPSDKQNVLWLHGLAGYGKSTISTTVAEYFRDLDRLGAFIFFDRNDPTHSDPNAVVRTLAYCLASFDARIQIAVSAAVEKDRSIAQAPLRKQFAKLLLQPLQSVGAQHITGPVIVVIDALDECGDPKSRKSLLALLAGELSKMPSIFRFVITSRAESDITAAFSEQPNILEKELHISTHSNENDIYSFICNEMEIIRQRHKVFKLATDWPGEAAIRDLLRRSAGLFIWASMAVNFIAEGYDPREQLQILLSASSHHKPEAALDALYETALNTAGKWDSETFVADFRAVMSVVLAGQIPVSDETIDAILSADGHTSSTFVLLLLRCLLLWNPGQPVRILHASFADYLTNPVRCGKNPWLIDISVANRSLAVACLQQMNSGLHFNICGLETSHVANEDVFGLPERILSSIPTHLAYSCQFWAHHIQKATRSDILSSEIRNFAYNNLLYWLEVLSLIGEINLASSALLKAAKWSRENDAGSDLAMFMVDASKLVTTFKDPISHSVPHIYLTALPFSPLESPVALHFHPRFPRTITVQTGRAARWPACIMRLDDHSSAVTSVAFSSDSKLIVTGSYDQTIRIWDVETGDIASGPFEGHTSSVNSVIFSPDRTQVISGSADMTVRIWDVQTGNTTIGPLKGHTDEVICVAISPDGKRIASGSKDTTIRLWDAKGGEAALAKFQGHASKINSVTFSGSKIVSGSDDCTVRVWDLDTRHCALAHFEPYNNEDISSVAVSQVGKHIICADWGLTYRVWDVETGNPVSEPYRGHSSHPSPITFSADNKRIAHSIGHGESDSTIEVRDAHSGRKLLEPLEGHTSSISCLAFSPDDKYIVSGSYDQTARVWDTEGNFNSGLLAHYSFSSCAFSQSGKQIISDSGDQTVRIWDAQTGDAVSGPFERNAGGVTSMAFSPDGKHIVLGLVDETLTIRVWEVQTGNAMSNLNGPTSTVNTVAFSPDCKRVVCGFEDSTVWVCDAETGNIVLGPFDEVIVNRRGGSRVTSVAFSPDGNLIAAGYFDARIIIWNAETGAIFTGPFSEGYTIHSVAFSPDGKWVVSGSTGSTVRIWDADTGDLVLELEGLEYMNHVNCAVFSPDGKHIAAGYEDKTISVWDVRAGTTTVGPLIGHGRSLNCIAFSPDSTCVVSSSWDRTIRVWDIGTGETSSTKKVTETGEIIWLDDSDTSEDGFTDRSRWKNGWILNSRSELLFWVPTWSRDRLWWPRNKVIIAKQYTKLDLSQFVHGTSWQQCKSAA